MKISAVVSAIQGCALLATFTLASMFPQVVQSRHSLSTVPTLSHGETPRVLSSKTKTTNDLQHLIDSYYAGDGFPKAGRSLQQKIQEADAFLTAEIAKTGSVGVGVAVVYNDQTVLAKGYGLRKLGDPATAVKADDMFEIGSVTKTFIALAIGLLVEDGKLQWLDPVKKHLSWLRLVDNYAEEYVRIGDLLSMNSGFGRLADFAMNTGAYNSSRDLVEALVSLEPDHPLRETPAYANINFAILGELIEEVSGQSWVQFLDNRIWKPLGMSHTFGATEDVPDNLKGALNKGHMTCRNTTLGPFEFDGSLKIEISPRIPHSADGSMVSSPSDMAKFLRLILNKGVVDGIRSFNSTSTISTMITGKNVAVDEIMDAIAQLPLIGINFLADGSTLSNGYGFDFIGNIMWGHPYAEKTGGTVAHESITAFVPHKNLAVSFHTNTRNGGLTLLNTYVLGIFLDVPKHILDFQYDSWQKSIALLSETNGPFPGAPVCGFAYWDNPPRLPISSSTRDTLTGEYAASVSPNFFPRMIISRAANENELSFQWGAINATLVYVGDANATMFFMTTGNIQVAIPAVAASPDPEHPGGYLVSVGMFDYLKQ